MVKQGSTWDDIAVLAQPQPDLTTRYGPASQHIGDWFFPRAKGKGSIPVVMLLHGGCWLNSYDRLHLYPLAKAFSGSGAVVWVPEYRRVGDAGGGWPGTFGDVVSALEHVADQAEELKLDLSRVIVAGHSAGGHLALWLNGWAQGAGVAPVPEVARSTRIELRGCLGLAAIADLTRYDALGNDCSQSLPKLLGGDKSTYPARWLFSDPMSYTPIMAPIHLIYGEDDIIVPPEQAEIFMAHAASPLVSGHRLEGATHFDVINPSSTAFHTALASVKTLLF